MIALHTAVSLSKRIATGLGLLGKLKGRWASAPAELRERLVANLSAAHACFEDIETELRAFMQIDPTTKPHFLAEQLLPFVSPTIDQRVSVVRAACSELHGVYVDHLVGWFSQHAALLTASEREQLEHLFVRDLGIRDDSLADRVGAMSTWIAETASQVRGFVDAGRTDEAERLLDSVTGDILQLRLSASATMLALRAAELVITSTATR